MNYRYEIITLEPKRQFMHVVYRSEGYDDVNKIFNPLDYSAEALKALIEAYSFHVLEIWAVMDTAPEVTLEGLGLAGEVSAAYVPPEPPPEPTIEELQLQLQAEIVSRTQQRLDVFAQTRNYDDILSAASYVASTNPVFAAEGQRAVDLRDGTWSALYSILAEVQGGLRPVPSSFSDIEPELPILSWDAETKESITAKPDFV